MRYRVDGRLVDYMTVYCPRRQQCKTVVWSESQIDICTQRRPILLPSSLFWSMSLASTRQNRPQGNRLHDNVVLTLTNRNTTLWFSLHELITNSLQYNLSILLTLQQLVLTMLIVVPEKYYFQSLGGQVPSPLPSLVSYAYMHAFGKWHSFIHPNQLLFISYDCYLLPRHFPLPRFQSPLSRYQGNQLNSGRHWCSTPNTCLPSTATDVC